MGKYVIGIDYGSLSARAVLVDTADGSILAVAEEVYAHGILTEGDISGGEPRATTALQHPIDYINALAHTVQRVRAESGVSRDDIVGLGIDCTASTVLPYKKGGTALALCPEFEKEPDAYIKLWKHHGAETEAERLTQFAAERGYTWLSEYGGVISAEWMLPKIAETYNRSPEVYRSADKFGEVGEWLCELITGVSAKSNATAGYKALWGEGRGYPEGELLSALHPELCDVYSKLCPEILPLGACQGSLNEYGSRLLDLPRGVKVAPCAIDAHAALPAAGAVESGDLMLIVGTSMCHILLSERDVDVPGICGKVPGGAIPDLYAYESGQPCVGDMFAWFVNNCLPKRYFDAAEERGVSIFDHLNSLAKSLEVGAGGLLALDWWNGNRSPYVNYELSGMIIGLTLKTLPEEIYLALLTSCAFGARRLVEIYRESGLEVRRIITAGGISKKNQFFMQLMADAIGMDIAVSSCVEAGAKGSAIYAAVAADCYTDVDEASQAMKDGFSAVYKPNKDLYDKYTELYNEYVRMSDHFANSDIMKRLRKN